MRIVIDYGIGNGISTESAIWFAELVNQSCTVGDLFRNPHVQSALGYGQRCGPYAGSVRLSEDTALSDGMHISVHELDCSKEAFAWRDVYRRLKEKVGLEFEAHGRRHDKYRTATGRRVTVPRHARDLTTGTLLSIIRQAGLDVSISELFAV